MPMGELVPAWGEVVRDGIGGWRVSEGWLTYR